jgi:hypothetical protein
MTPEVPAGHGAPESSVDKLLSILEQGDAQEAPEMPVEYQHLEEQLKLQEIRLKRKYAKQEIDLRREYARGLLTVLSVQLCVADVVFVVFAWAGERWHLSDGVIQIWLAAVVVQVIGVVTVVTQHLFPRRDGKPSDALS